MITGATVIDVTAVLKCLAMVKFLKNNLTDSILEPNKNELIAIACLLDLISVG
ncbi:hypothetical protein [Cylindrospermopsis raciborskii]|uniref:hypothetical protein n=1 Tax=Cylindrospermopsis raciborskii TaxID=77022 RepID=UPI000300C338|nr:hypothetical protein [Cylindrospermopsis raciborskii]